MQLRPISKELQQIAIDECNEDPRRIEQDVRSIREWINKQPHLKDRTRTSDQAIVEALRLHKYRFQEVKRRIDALYTTKAEMPEVFTNRDPDSPRVQKLLDAGICLPLSKTVGPNGPVVVLLRMRDADMSTMTVTNLAILGTMVLDVLLKESDEAIISGGHLIIDCKGIKVQDGLRLGMDVMQLAFKLSNDSYGLRPKGIYFLNPLPFMEVMFNQVKLMLMKEKLHNRVHFFPDTTNYDKLHTFLPPSILPKELGGDFETIPELTEKWKKKVESYREWFLEDANYCADLTKRREDAIDKDELFGTIGSFKKLVLD